MVYRLYKIHSDTGKKSGAKRDYPSEEHFLKYGQETFERYNSKALYNKGQEAELCFLNSSNKWEKLGKKELNELLSKFPQNKK